MNYFEKNIKALKTRDEKIALWVESANEPENLELVTSKTGLPVPRLGSVLFHSAYYPEREGAKLVASNRVDVASVVAVFGFGFGYHLEQIVECGPSVIVIEPDPGIIKAAFKTRDLTSLIEKVTLMSADMFAESAASLDYSAAMWIDHEPTKRLHLKERTLLAEPFMVRVLAKTREYKVMVVGPVYGGSVPTAQFLADALCDLGFVVDFVDNTVHHAELLGQSAITTNEMNRANLRTLFNNYLGEKIVARADFFKPDVIVALAQAPLEPPAIEKLKTLGAPIVFWFVENYRMLPYWKLVAPLYDYFFGIQKGEFLDKLQSASAPYAGYLPQAANPKIHRPLDLSADETEKYGSKISFMGAGYPNRKKFFAGLLDQPFSIWGTEWDLHTPLGKLVRNQNRRLAPDEYVKIFNASEVNLNLHSSKASAGVDPVGDFINPRTFEIASCCAFQLVDERHDLADMFDVEREIVSFRNMDDLREKINHYLKNPKERFAVAEAGRKRVLKEHTFLHRAAGMMSVVLSRDEDKIEKKRRAGGEENTIGSIIKRSNNPELSAFLSQFPKDKKLQLKDVMSAINRGEGDLTRPEAIFLMIDQLLLQG